ncbi:MAG: DUF4271 domain-containing protein [Bacteroidia bacterium]|nr:DUF4271 domain-containing protein [Bacteroidia bacterium]
MNQQSLFEQHELTPVHNGPVSLNGTTPFWLLAVLLVIMIFVIIVRIFYRKNISELMAALFSLSVTNQLVRDESILLQRTSLLLTVIFNLSAAVLLWQFGSTLSSKLPFAHTDFTRFLVFAFLIAMTYSLKYLILRLAGFIFGTEEETDAYIFNIFLSNNFFGMVLFPVVGLLFLYPQLRDSSPISTGILIAAACVFIYRILRGILIGRASSSYSAVYLFFYLCALEIAPLLVLLKVVTRQ